jgi:hypothetical protein
LSSADLLPFVITRGKYQTHSHATPSPEQYAVEKRLVEGEGFTQKNAANIRGVEGAGSARIQA